MSKRSPEDILKDIEQSDVDDQVDRVLAMSPEERVKELEEAGYTRAELDAKADAMFERMQQAEREGARERLEAEGRSRSLGPPARSSRRVLLLAAALFAAVVLALLLFPRLSGRETPLAVPSASAPASSAVGLSPPHPSSPSASASAPAFDAAPSPAPSHVPEASGPPPIK